MARGTISAGTGQPPRIPMKYASRFQKPQPFGQRAKEAARPHQQPALGEDRYQALLAQANAFFATAERDMVAEKAAAIVEIQALMAEYGLTLDDLAN